MRLNGKRFAAAAVGSILLIGALALPAVAGAAPKFGKRYVGTLSGSTTDTNTNGTALSTDWSITSLRFKRKKIQSFGSTRTAIYKVTGGSITLNAVKSGSCTYEVHQQLDLVDALSKPEIAAPLALSYVSSTKDLRADGTLTIDPIATTQTCTYSDGTTDVSTVEFSIPQPLMNIGFTTPKSFKRLHGTHKQNDTYSYGEGKTTATWHWDLKSK